MKPKIITARKLASRFLFLFCAATPFGCSPFTRAGRVACVAAFLWGSTPTPGTAAIAPVRSLKSGFNGGGIRVAQVEASTVAGALAFEVNPAAVGQPASLFSYISDQGRRAGFPNTAGVESDHAAAVAIQFYGMSSGLATNVVHVDNWEAQSFWRRVISANPPLAIPDRVVNQSWVFGGVTIDDQKAIDVLYDRYAARYNVLFVSGAGNGGAVSPPGTCYNGIAAGAYGGLSSVGPTPDNRRGKPDLSAAAVESSYAAPQVAGAGAVLAQAALRGDGGIGSRSAADRRALKALLLNGAIKPSGWTNSSSSPLDARYGAGICNVSNSYAQLLGGKHRYSAAARVGSGGAHPPVSGKRIIGSSRGFDLNVIASSARFDGLRHYQFQLGDGTNSGSFVATVTLVWNRRPDAAAASNLDLFLYSADSGALVSSSTSRVDNVEHLFATGLEQGNYDLQVRKSGGAGAGGLEMYALAFEFRQGGAEMLFNTK